MNVQQQGSTRILDALLGVAVLGVAIAGFLGWPRPFDPAHGWLLLFMATCGLILLGRGLSRRPWAPLTIVLAGVALLLAVLVPAETPWLL